MADHKDTEPSVVQTDPGTPFSKMSGGEKVTWVGKVFVMLLTGGFAFPNIFVE